MANTTKPWYKTWPGISIVAFLILISALLAASAFYFYSSYRTAQSSIKQNAFKLTGQTYPAAQGKHYWLGSAKPKITIVEFGDFACHHTAREFPIVRELGLKYKDDVRVVWRDYPLVAEHSILLALAARCAGEQGLFWPMYDKLFQNQGVYQAEQLIALAKQIGADTARFSDCAREQKYLKEIKQDITDGQAFGINGTPTFFINGYKVEGEIPYDVFEKIIEELKK